MLQVLFNGHVADHLIVLEALLELPFVPLVRVEGGDPCHGGAGHGVVREDHAGHHLAARAAAHAAAHQGGALPD